VGALTSATPEKADYPFTTKGITVGHLMVDGFRVQMMDTPGLLDRPMDTRNKMELQAILCLEEVADVCVFLFDGSPARYYPMEQQVEMLEEIDDIFPGLLVMPSLNKIDLEVIDFQALADSPYRNCLRISSLRKVGLDDLKDRIAASLRRAGVEPSPFPQWKS
jgi:nucleolar GTP-binding protein